MYSVLRYSFGSTKANLLAACRRLPPTAESELISQETQGPKHMMQNLASDSIVLKTLRLEKEIFWTEHNLLPPDHIQHLWAAKNASLTSGLSSVLGPAAPTERFDLTSEPRHIPQLTPNMTRAQSVWLSALFSGPLD